MATEKRLISVDDCPCDGCKAKPCGHPARCVKFALWLNKTMDAVEVVHSRWISEVVRKPDWKGKMREFYQAASCPICHNPDPGHGTSNYCPNCGAKMDGDGNG